MASAAHMPTTAPKLMDRAEALTPWVLPPAMKWTPHEMNDIQTCMLRALKLPMPNSQVSTTASTPTTRASAASLGIGFPPPRICYRRSDAPAAWGEPMPSMVNVQQGAGAVQGRVHSPLLSAQTRSTASAMESSTRVGR